MKSIVVFCGSSAGNHPVYLQQAMQLGAALAQRNITLVYGGAKVGLMGAVADSCLQAGGKVIGVLPHFLQQKEVAHEGLTTLILVNTMHERKTKMNELGDGVIALPGGFGTMEELFEMLTWGQLGLHKKPIGLLNTNGFYNSLIQLSQTMTEHGFLKAENRDMLLHSDNLEDLLLKMENYQPPTQSKWITPAQS
ncbi:TIGR00730 family Rossman fold protein [Chitinophaga sp. 30R24]|uniref:LOG family protein n=1 Tax=Chitinophaga sp. 30R24 TaxID=3248838 RepID=UPI003B8EEDD8